jgi:anti-sigma B factor antagonist
MDSTGLGALVSALKAARKANGDISIIAPSPQVQKLLKLTAMDPVFLIFTSPEEALQQPGGRSG